VLLKIKKGPQSRGPQDYKELRSPPRQRACKKRNSLLRPKLCDFSLAY